PRRTPLQTPPVHAALPICTLLAACGDRAVNWTLYDVKGHLPDLQFQLPGAGGKTVSSEDLKGKTVMLFFGYASCPDICPTTMAQDRKSTRLNSSHVKISYA